MFRTNTKRTFNFLSGNYSILKILIELKYISKSSTNALRKKYEQPKIKRFYRDYIPKDTPMMTTIVVGTRSRNGRSRK